MSPFCNSYQNKNIFLYLQSILLYNLNEYKQKLLIRKKTKKLEYIYFKIIIYIYIYMQQSPKFIFQSLFVSSQNYHHRNYN
jgi:hypothetical protein